MRILLAVALLGAGRALAADAPSKPAEPAPAQGAAPSSADAKKPAAEWFKNWRRGLENSAVSGHHRKLKSHQVAAVRGFNQSGNPRAPYWKDGISKQADAELQAERKELLAVTDLVAEGKDGEAGKALDAFEAKHPKSSFKDEVRAAREQLAPKTP